MHKVNNKFTKSSYFITELTLCAVRSINNKNFPWIILIPKRINVTDITELQTNDQILLIKVKLYCGTVPQDTLKIQNLLMGVSK